MNKNLKVVILCKYDLSEFKNELIGENISKVFSPWVTAIVNELKYNPNVDLHVISENIFLRKDYNINKNNVNYYFINHGYNILILHNRYILKIVYKINYLTSNYLLRKKTKKIINTINPDIIHLMGTEIPLATVILDIKYKHLISIQGMLNLVYDINPTRRLRAYLKKYEYKIYSKGNNFGIRSNHMRETIRKHNLNAKFYNHNFPVNSFVYNNQKDDKKDTDIIFFGRITEIKGIEDLIIALSLLKKSAINFNCKIIGQCEENYKEYIKKMIIDENLDNNIRLIGELSSQEEVFQEVKKSKIAVLPSRIDITPGTIIESILLGVPVISYNVGEIPSLIKNGETGILVEKGDILGLKDAIAKLLDDDNLRCLYSKKGKALINKSYYVKNVVRKLLIIYDNIINE